MGRMDWELGDGGMIDNEFIEIECVSRIVMPIIFMIDTSDRMSGPNIDTLNQIMEDIMNDFRDFVNADFELRNAVLSFGSDCVWKTPGLVPWDGMWERFDAGGMACFNTACEELCRKLSGKSDRNGLFAFPCGRTMTIPTIVLLTNGYAADGDVNGKEGITALLENRYFKCSLRVAIAIGGDANMTLCQNFASKEGCVFTTYDENVFKMILQCYHDSMLS